MNRKQRHFVSEYLKDHNGAQAAIRAGYSKKTARHQASDLLAKPDIAQAVARGQERLLEKNELTASRVLEEMRRAAFGNIQDFYDERGNLKGIHELTREQSSCLASMEVIMKNALAGDGIIDRVHKLRLVDKLKALEMLGKHFALLTERVELSATEDLLRRLDEGRARNARGEGSS